MARTQRCQLARFGTAVTSVSWRGKQGRELGDWPSITQQVMSGLEPGSQPALDHALSGRSLSAA